MLREKVAFEEAAVTNGESKRLFGVSSVYRVSGDFFFPRKTNEIRSGRVLPFLHTNTRIAREPRVDSRLALAASRAGLHSLDDCVAVAGFTEVSSRCRTLPDKPCLYLQAEQLGRNLPAQNKQARNTYLAPVKPPRHRAAGKTTSILAAGVLSKSWPIYETPIQVSGLRLLSVQ